MTRIQFQQHVKQIVKAVVPDRLMEAAYDVWYAGFPVPIRTVRPFTLLSNINLFFLMELMRRLDEQRVEGNIIECGVYKGGSAGVLGYAVSRSPFVSVRSAHVSFGTEVRDPSEAHGVAMKGGSDGTDEERSGVASRQAPVLA